jgi:serine/threonine-protein kinase
LELRGQSSPLRIKRYSVNLQKGQELGVEVKQGDVALDILDPNGQLVRGASGVQQWTDKVPSAGEYKINVIAQKPTDFTLNISVGNSQ